LSDNGLSVEKSEEQIIEDNQVSDFNKRGDKEEEIFAAFEKDFEKGCRKSCTWGGF
jgi:hypothetical protein